MGRSIKKGPFVDFHLLEKIQKAKDTKSKTPIKTWSRRSMITPDFVAKTLKSAIANAEDLKSHKQEFRNMNTDRLVIKEAVAQTASIIRRFTPKARGSAGPILKR